jgi:hypothetical protein
VTHNPSFGRRRFARPDVGRGLAWTALFCLAAALAGCGAAGQVRREFGPWRTERDAGLAFRVPQEFGKHVEGAFALHRPPGELDALPFIGVAAIPAAAAGDNLDDFLANLTPRGHDAQLKIRAAKFTVRGRPVRGFETDENGVRGWTCIFDKKGRPFAALLIGTPDHWRPERADAFRDIVLKSVKVL